ncbi:hypothetical protein BK660_23220 [Pseudomonas brassicacearum]|uniref:Uncharacterized protein n=1 Tax=Pseudomonas brassicacearum TaxID=930166 RepID=A0A423HWN7_9PSED|nr:hypothetical protein [Pseudomonas brassicacearum]RON17566.1 hypothetical protein BK660_23220 [Pseudomonas brassicacearum]
MSDDETDAVKEFYKALTAFEARQMSARKRAALQRAYQALGWETTYTTKDSDLTELRDIGRDVGTRTGTPEERRAGLQIQARITELILAIRGRRIEPGRDYRKRAGGRASGRKNHEAALERQFEVVALWNKYAYKPPHTRVGTIADQTGYSKISVRRYLNNAGITW